MSDFDFKPDHKFFRVTILSVNYSKSTNTDVMSLNVQNKSPYKIRLSLGFLCYRETKATFHPTQERELYRENKNFKITTCL